MHWLKKGSAETHEGGTYIGNPRKMVHRESKQAVRTGYLCGEVYFFKNNNNKRDGDCQATWSLVTIAVACIWFDQITMVWFDGQPCMLITLCTGHRD